MVRTHDIVRTQIRIFSSVFTVRTYESAKTVRKFTSNLEVSYEEDCA